MSKTNKKVEEAIIQGTALEKAKIQRKKDIEKELKRLDVDEAIIKEKLKQVKIIKEEIIRQRATVGPELINKQLKYLRDEGSCEWCDTSAKTEHGKETFLICQNKAVSLSYFTIKDPSRALRCYWYLENEVKRIGHTKYFIKRVLVPFFKVTQFLINWSVSASVDDKIERAKRKLENLKKRLKNQEKTRKKNGKQSNMEKQKIEKTTEFFCPKCRNIEPSKELGYKPIPNGLKMIRKCLTCNGGIEALLSWEKEELKNLPFEEIVEKRTNWKLKTIELTKDLLGSLLTRKEMLELANAPPILEEGEAPEMYEKEWQRYREAQKNNEEEDLEKM